MLKAFKIEGEITKKQSLTISLLGFVGLLTIWHVVATYSNISTSILPSPLEVASSFGFLFESHLLKNALFSLKLNFSGYIEAVLISLPIGFAMGLVPGIRALVSKYFDALRFLPLPAITGIFVALFGLGTGLKVHFLSFGILLYLIPVVVQRIDEIENLHKQTITTLGATKWQKVRHLYFPYAMSKISDDIRVLVAISWTYIVIVELLNMEGGLGGMIFVSAKQSQTPSIYALVLIIVMFGYLQDLLFKYLDKLIFPFKHGGQVKKSLTKYILK